MQVTVNSAVLMFIEMLPEECLGFPDALVRGPYAAQLFNSAHET